MWRPHCTFEPTIITSVAPLSCSHSKTNGFSLIGMKRLMSQPTTKTAVEGLTEYLQRWTGIPGGQSSHTLLSTNPGHEYRNPLETSKLSFLLYLPDDTTMYHTHIYISFNYLHKLQLPAC